MRYLKRLKNELLELTEELAPKSVTPSVRKLVRKNALVAIIEMVRGARAIDHACDDWSQENAEGWTDFLDQMRSWLASMPTPPKKSKKAA